MGKFTFFAESFRCNVRSHLFVSTQRFESKSAGIKKNLGSRAIKDVEKQTPTPTSTLSSSVAIISPKLTNTIISRRDLAVKKLKSRPVPIAVIEDSIMCDFKLLILPIDIFQNDDNTIMSLVKPCLSSNSGQSGKHFTQFLAYTYSDGDQQHVSVEEIGKELDNSLASDESSSGNRTVADKADSVEVLCACGRKEKIQLSPAFYSAEANSTHTATNVEDDDCYKTKTKILYENVQSKLETTRATEQTLVIRKKPISWKNIAKRGSLVSLDDKTNRDRTESSFTARARSVKPTYSPVEGRIVFDEDDTQVDKLEVSKAPPKSEKSKLHPKTANKTFPIKTQATLDEVKEKKTFPTGRKSDTFDAKIRRWQERKAKLNKKKLASETPTKDKFKRLNTTSSSEQTENNEAAAVSAIGFETTKGTESVNGIANISKMTANRIEPLTEAVNQEEQKHGNQLVKKDTINDALPEQLKKFDAEVVLKLSKPVGKRSLAIEMQSLADTTTEILDTAGAFKVLNKLGFNVDALIVQNKVYDDENETKPTAETKTKPEHSKSTSLSLKERGLTDPENIDEKALLQHVWSAIGSTFYESGSLEKCDYMVHLFQYMNEKMKHTFFGINLPDQSNSFGTQEPKVNSIYKFGNTIHAINTNNDFEKYVLDQALIKTKEIAEKKKQNKEQAIVAATMDEPKVREMFQELLEDAKHDFKALLSDEKSETDGRSRTIDENIEEMVKEYMEVMAKSVIFKPKPISVRVPNYNESNYEENEENYRMPEEENMKENKLQRNPLRINMAAFKRGQVKNVQLESCDFQVEPAEIKYYGAISDNSDSDKAETTTNSYQNCEQRKRSETTDFIKELMKEDITRTEKLMEAEKREENEEACKGVEILEESIRKFKRKGVESATDEGIISQTKVEQFNESAEEVSEGVVYDEELTEATEDEQVFHEETEDNAQNLLATRDGNTIHKKQTTLVVRPNTNVQELLEKQQNFAVKLSIPKSLSQENSDVRNAILKNIAKKTTNAMFAQQQQQQQIKRQLKDSSTDYVDGLLLEQDYDAAKQSNGSAMQLQNALQHMLNNRIHKDDFTKNIHASQFSKSFSIKLMKSVIEINEKVLEHIKKNILENKQTDGAADGNADVNAK